LGDSQNSQTLSGHCLDLFDKLLLLNRAEMAEIGDRFWGPFCRNGKLPRQGFPDTGHGQEIGGQGIFAAILILRFHDIKTLAPRGVNNS
jgi:hypothetical protein